MLTSHYNRSVLMVIMGGVCLSFLGIADRSMDGASGPQIAFYRAVSQSIFFAFVFLLTKQASVAAEFKALSWRGWFAALIMALAGFFLIMAFQYTLVANAIFFISLTPLIAAALAWVFLKERINRRTAAAMVIALTGVMIIFGSNINGEGAIGMGLAAMMTVCYAGSIVMIRTVPQANIILICTLNAVLTVALVGPLLDGFVLSQKDILICLGLGIVQVGLGTVFVMTGARHVPAAQVSILALIEVVLSPIWVWIFANEVPPVTTLIGGAVVLMGVTYQALGTRSTQKQDIPRL